MKKWMNILMVTVLAAVLTACNDTAEPVDNSSSQNNEANNADEENVSDLTAEEVYEEALEASESMESAEVEMTMDQTMTSPDEDETINSLIDTSMEMTLDPLTLHQSMQMTMDLDDEEIKSDMEMYVTEDNFYMYEEQLDEWLKLDASIMGDIDQLIDQQDPEDQLEMLEEFVSDFEFEQSDDEFILKLTADGDEFSSLVKEMAQEAMPPEMMDDIAEEGLDVFDEMDINAMNYEMHIDKETFDLKNFNMEMDMDLDVEGEATNIHQVTEAEYLSINSIDPIEIPEEVEEEAIDESEL